ncbi:YeeE/YedE family protein [Rhodoferax sp. BAB1]|uniref:YeeE/YedE family protein n=1 Tax=Rhodoferax sp. BAB1 TaxID=2741720 RepID=UPI0015773931|nr:YeeE/YedE family protein [Rhodoferax sp. BAB1]QKO21889.1 YeeE/YedE family protein [Rhodoferax sp. BAB1]
MQTADISALNTLVLSASFLLSLLFGALVQRTHFCTMGAVSDVVNMGDWTRMRQWGLAIGVAMAGFALLAYAGLIDPAKTLHGGKRWLWLSAIVGGLLFGFGMVLSSGCGSKTLVRVGSGNLKSLVVLLVMGMTGFATMKGITAVWRVATVDQVGVDFAVTANLPHLAATALGLTPSLAALLLGLGLGAALIVWALRGQQFMQGENLLAGLGVGGLIVAMWWVSGSLGHVAEHPDTLEEVFLATNSGRSEAMSFVAPVAYALDWLMFYSDKSKVLTLGIVSVFGVIAGSAIMALWTRSFRWEGFGGTEDVANHLVGAVLMGVGGVTAMGCTIGQGLTGLSTLGLNSLVAFVAILAGSVAGFKYQMWRLERMT